MFFFVVVRCSLFQCLKNSKQGIVKHTKTKEKKKKTLFDIFVVVVSTFSNGANNRLCTRHSKIYEKSEFMFRHSVVHVSIHLRVLCGFVFGFCLARCFVPYFIWNKRIFCRHVIHNMVTFSFLPFFLFYLFNAMCDLLNFQLIMWITVSSSIRWRLPNYSCFSFIKEKQKLLFVLVSYTIYFCWIWIFKFHRYQSVTFFLLLIECSNNK